MKVLVIFALESEFAPWQRRRSFEPLAGAEFPQFQDSLRDLQLRVAISGVGAERAQRVSREALRWKPDICIASGFAGGLNATLHTGEVFVAGSVRDSESHRTHAADARLLSLAEQAGAKRIATLCTSAYTISTVSDKQRLASTADAVDMESFFVLNEADSRGISAIALRVVSDAADEALPLDFTGVLDERGHVRIPRLAAKIVRAPHRIPALLRLGNASRRGAQRLAEVLEQTVESLSEEPGMVLQRPVEVATA